MTNQEAIDIIKVAIAEVERNAELFSWCYPMDYSVAFEMAIEAMKKQIPMKPKEEWSEPIFTGDKGCQFLHLMCPDCGKMEVNQLASHCPRCGKALDWTDDSTLTENGKNC